MFCGGSLSSRSLFYGSSLGSGLSGSFGFGSGGGDYGKQGQTNFGGGGGAGVKIDPVAFLVIKDGTTRVMPVAVPPVSTVDRIVDMAPDIVDKIGKFFDKKDGDETV